MSAVLRASLASKPTEGFADRPSRCDSDILRQFFFKHFQTKEKQKWQPYFYKAGRHILQTPKKLGAWTSCGGDGVGGEQRPTRTQRCVYHVKGMNDCLRRIAGLNSPASPPLKKTDTSYNNHALQKKKNSTETDKMQARPKTPRRLKQPYRGVEVKM